MTHTLFVKELSSFFEQASFAQNLSTNFKNSAFQTIFNPIKKNTARIFFGEN